MSADRAATKWRQRLGRAAWLGCCVAIALPVLLAACVRVAQLPEPKPAPVFELQVIDRRPCPTAADRQVACFTVELRNRGEKAGTGTCVVRHCVRGGEALIGEARPSRLVYDQARRCGPRVRRT